LSRTVGPFSEITEAQHVSHILEKFGTFNVGIALGHMCERLIKFNIGQHRKVEAVGSLEYPLRS
jgi:hypothetical protein